jgi:hypothetical protein
MTTLSALQKLSTSIRHQQRAVLSHDEAAALQAYIDHILMGHNAVVVDDDNHVIASGKVCATACAEGRAAEAEAG